MRTLNDYFLTVPIADLSTASSGYVAVPDAGEITDVYVCMAAAITVAAAKISVAPNGGTDVLALSIAVADSGVGAVVSKRCTTNSVARGDMIKVSTDGSSTTTSAAIVTIVIRR